MIPYIRRARLADLEGRLKTEESRPLICHNPLLLSILRSEIAMIRREIHLNTYQEAV